MEPPATKTVYLAVTVEEKKENGRLPRFGEVSVNTQDMLADLGHLVDELPWVITSVTEVHVPGAGVQIGDVSHHGSAFKAG
jgi:hypothetical protein